jgi:predicted ATPase
MNAEQDGSTMDRYVREVKLRREKVGSFDTYPFNLPVVCHLETLELHPAVTFLVGENGSGKSTLLEALAGACAGRGVILP